MLGAGTREGEPRPGPGGRPASPRRVSPVEGPPVRRQGRSLRRQDFPGGHRPLPGLPELRTGSQGPAGSPRWNHLR